MKLAEKQVYGPISNPSAVPNPFFYGIAKVKSNQDTGDAIFIRSLREVGILPEDRRCIATPAAHGQGETTRAEGNIVGTKEIPQDLRGCAPLDAMRGVVVRDGRCRD